MAGNKNNIIETTENPRPGEVWGYEGFGLQGQEDKYVFAVAFCIDGGPLRVSAAHSETQSPDDVREKYFDRCLSSIERTWKATTPGFIEGKHELTPWAGMGVRLLAPPTINGAPL